MSTSKPGGIVYIACLIIVFVNLTYIFGMTAFSLAEDVFTEVYEENTSTTYAVSPKAFLLGAIPALAITYLVHKLSQKSWRRKRLFKAGQR